MSKDSTLSDLEIRIAFLEDQIDALNREVVSLNRDRDKLTEELQALAHLTPRSIINATGVANKNPLESMPTKTSGCHSSIASRMSSQTVRSRSACSMMGAMS
jgi:uncharacterized coiled-coil protein SlyX